MQHQRASTTKINKKEKKFREKQLKKLQGLFGLGSPKWDYRVFIIPETVDRILFRTHRLASC